MRRHGDHGEATLRNGFRHRGREITRLEVFVDAAFAFAVTLLVISIDSIPDTVDGLVEVLKGVPAFGASLAMIALFWSAHARWSRQYGLEDATTTVLSLALVFLVLVYVYPLKIMFASFFGFITGGWLPYQLQVTGYGDVAMVFVIYGSGFVGLSLCLLGLYLHAWRQRDRLALDTREREQTAGEIATYLWFVTVGLLSILLALAMPVNPHPWMTGAPGMAYFLMFFTGVAEWGGRRWQQRRQVSA